MINKTVIDNFRTALRRREKTGEKIVINVTFFRGTSKELLLDHAPIAAVGQINKILKDTPYDRVKIDAIDTSGLSKKVVKSQVFSIIDHENDENEGLSGVELSRVERFLAKKEREEEYSDLCEKNQEYQKYIKELEDNVEELEDYVEELEAAINEKKTSRFDKYVPLLQGFAKSMGLDSDLTEALGGVLAPAKPVDQIADSSGIIEDENLSSVETSAAKKEYQRKSEMVQLMINSIMEKDSAFVSKFFTLYSELEKSPTVLSNILVNLLNNNV